MHSGQRLLFKPWFKAKVVKKPFADHAAWFKMSIQETIRFWDINSVILVFHLVWDIIFCSKVFQYFCTTFASNKRLDLKLCIELIHKMSQKVFQYWYTILQSYVVKMLNNILVDSYVALSVTKQCFISHHTKYQFC